MLVLLLTACAPPFDETRKDLAGFRLAGMAAAPGAPDGGLRALVWSGEGAFHAIAPTIEWTIDGEIVTAAPAAPFTAHVRVESAAGAVEEGELVVAADATIFSAPDFSREVTDGGASLALTVDVDAVTRWMSSAGAFVETGPHAADWTLAEPVDEDDEDAEPVVPEPGPAAIVALTLDGRGGNTWSWIDVATDAGPYLAVGGRLLPVDVAPEPGEQDWLATITPADTLAGLVLTELAEAGDDPGAVVCGLDPFDADALADGRCGRDEAAGARVRVTGAAWP